MKTRLEVAREEANAQDVTGELTTLTSGVSFQDLRIGGGREPQRRDLVVLDFRCVIALSTSPLQIFAVLIPPNRSQQLISGILGYM